jgi:hypothetical protein
MRSRVTVAGAMILFLSGFICLPTLAEHQEDLEAQGFPTHVLPTRGYEFGTSVINENNPALETDIEVRRKTQDNEMTPRISYYNRKIVDYVKAIYNSREAPKIISQDGGSVVEFFRLADEMFLDVEDSYSCLRMLHGKVKSCEIIDDVAVNEILETIPERLMRYFIDSQVPSYSVESLEKGMEKLMLDHFTNHFSSFTDKPTEFVTNLCHTLSVHAKSTNGGSGDATLMEGEWKSRLRTLNVRFIESIISKEMWDENAYEGIWNSVMKSANSIYQLATYKVVSHMDDLDDLFKSLNSRFIWFLDFSAGKMPTSFYEEIEEDVANGAAFHLELGEQDEGIRSKKEDLLEAVMKAKSKAVAIEKGILVPEMA